MDQAVSLVADIRLNGPGIETWFDANSDWSRKFLLFPDWLLRLRATAATFWTTISQKPLRPAVGLSSIRLRDVVAAECRPACPISETWRLMCEGSRKKDLHTRTG